MCPCATHPVCLLFQKRLHHLVARGTDDEVCLAVPRRWLQIHYHRPPLRRAAAARNCAPLGLQTVPRVYVYRPVSIQRDASRMHLGVGYLA